jgi:hypothetical protein
MRMSKGDLVLRLRPEPETASIRPEIWALVVFTP